MACLPKARPSKRRHNFSNLWVKIFKTDPKCRTQNRPYTHRNRPRQSAGGL